MALPPARAHGPDTLSTLRSENAALALRLEEAEETIRAIRRGAVDAFVVEESANYRVYTLEGAERPYRLFVEQMQQGVATLRQDGSIAYCNKRLAELLDVPHEQLIGALFHDLVASDDRAVYADLLARGQARSSRGEARLRRADGILVPAHFVFEALPPDSGALVGVFVTDLTAQKHREQLLAAQEALRDADRRKNEFLATLAHELRNPLAPMRNAVDILRRSAGNAAEVQATCAMLERQVGQMARFISDLLDVSRISQNKIELRTQRIELASVVDQAIESIQPMCRSMGHALTVTLPPAPVYLDGDAVRLTQVFANLLDNACKYMEKGGRVELSAESSNTHRERPGEVVVRIKDRGIGIAGNQLSRIFEMFAQVDTSLERAHSGLGIGLTLVKKLVEMHGGRVEAHSDGLGEGSEFAVHLPISTATAPTQVQAAATPPGPTYRILVVDDNRDSAESLAQVLKLSGGHETHTAFDGEAAVKAAAALRPEVVLLDVGMPRMNGYDVCRRIRAQPWGSDMVLIAQTGWGQSEDRSRTAEAGFDGHLIKPLDHAAVMAMLASLVSVRRAR